MSDSCSHADVCPHQYLQDAVSLKKVALFGRLCFRKLRSYILKERDLNLTKKPYNEAATKCYDELFFDLSDSRTHIYLLAVSTADYRFTLSGFEPWAKGIISHTNEVEVNFY